MLLRVDNKQELEKVISEARKNRILVAEFYEKDIGLTAIATRPIIEKHERNLFRRYKLL